MPAVNVEVGAFRDGDFPPVCARTGGPATATHRLVVIGHGTFGDSISKRRRMLGRGGIGRVVGYVPLTDTAARRTVLVERLRATFSAVAVVAFVVGMFTNVWLLGASVLLAVLLGLSLFLTVGGELDKRGEHVTLLHVHPSFAEAVAQREKGA